jgi:hypothetical protein
MGRFRALDESPKQPDAYPLNVGVMKLRESIWQGPDLIAQLRAALGRR